MESNTENSGNSVCYADTDFRKYFLEAIGRCSRIYKSRLEDCRANFTEESVHDLRVSIRRFQSLIDLLQSIMPNPYLVKIYKILKKQVKIFSPLRDTQVQLLKIQPIRTTSTEMNLFYYELLAREERSINAIRESLAGIATRKLESLLFLLSLYIKQSFPANQDACNSILTILDTVYSEAMELKSQLNREDLKTFHRLRLKIKRLRYLQEHLQPVLGITKKDLGRIRDYQTMLGEIQDSVVLTEKIKEYATVQEELPYKSFRVIIEYSIIDTARLIDSFMLKADMLDEFWQIKVPNT